MSIPGYDRWKTRSDRDDRPDWDDQFAESDEETAERWAAIKRKRREAGRCVICNRLPAVCECKIEGAS